jgi:hypothetical protein
MKQAKDEVVDGLVVRCVYGRGGVWFAVQRELAIVLFLRMILRGKISKRGIVAI